MFITKVLGVSLAALLLAEGGAPNTTRKAEPATGNPTGMPKTVPAAAKQVAAAPKSRQSEAPAAKIAAASAASKIPTAFPLHSIEAAVVEQTNAQRAQHGLPPLMVDQRLVQSARAHTAWMSRSRRMQHTLRPVAENIAMGQRSAGEAVRSWMSSSGHRANILNGGHRRIGVSAYSSSDGTVFWTQQFEP